MESEIKNAELDVKEARVMRLPSDLMEDHRARLGKLIDLTETQKIRLKQWLKNRLSEWESDTSDLHKYLEYDNDLVEGVVYETNEPWEGASNIHVGIPETYMDIHESIFKRSILGADKIWYAEVGSDDPDLSEKGAEIETMMNYKARNEWNIEKCLKDMFWITPRDGLGAMEINWCEEYKRKTDVLMFTNLDEFLKEFPTAESAGLTEEEWMEFALDVEKNASDETPVEIPVTFDKRVYYGNKGESIDYVNFVTIPATVPDIRDEMCRGYGRRYLIRGGTVRKNIKDNYFYSDEAKQLLQKDGYTESNFTLAQDMIEGFRRSNKKGEFEVFSLNIIGTLNGLEGKQDGDEKYDEEMEFQVVYSKEHDILLRCIEYPYRVCNYAIFRIDSRPNRQRGRSIPDKCRDASDEIDDQHNHRVNSRKLSTAPIFKGLLSKKNEIDLMLKEQRIKPGRVLWMSDFNAFDQFKIQPTDLGESIAEETNTKNNLDLRMGAAAALLSGQAPTGDPNAPGNKTAMLLNQSNLRMDNPLDELRDGVEQVGEICLSHTYQFGPAIIQYMATDEEGKYSQVRSIHKKYLRHKINLKMNGVTVMANPEFEMQKQFQIHQMLMTEPVYGQDDQLRIEGLRMALRAGRVPGRSRLLPPLDKIKERQVQIQMEAMRRMAMEKQAEAEAQAIKDQDERLKSAKRELDIKGTAKRMAEVNLNLNGNGGRPGTPPSPIAPVSMGGPQ